MPDGILAATIRPAGRPYNPLRHRHNLPRMGGGVSLLLHGAAISGLVLAAHHASPIAVPPWETGVTMIFTTTEPPAPAVDTEPPAPPPPAEPIEPLPRTDPTPAPQPAVASPLPPAPLAQEPPTPSLPLPPVPPEPPARAANLVRPRHAALVAPPASRSAAAPPPASVSSDRPTIPPRPVAGMADNRPPLYPDAARRRREQGRVLLHVDVSADGAPTGWTVTESSGHPTLDAAAIAAVREWRFVPASQDGRPIAAAANVPIVFRLDE